MNIDQATDLAREALWVAMVVSGPVLMVGIGLGFLTSLFQAVTQLQDQTLSLVPKLAAMLIVALITLPWVGAKLIEYSREMFGAY